MYKKFIHSRVFSVMILCLSAGMIYYGYNNGEVKVVLDKAIRICMECIGIG
ncbi:MAG: CD1871A family CXXC motif-containing protein [Finegoldia magna]|uniref:CD1871A family CXXC motif-containing protein n=1 Tax=Finegoldia magna TaxID=1260 RepID=UPI0029140F75|nr:CD1871A family CXXC motif-containing protein [Finegoldia magna]MDU5272867.1 CD1871A family CXXC motif-containing protein [Finegoldia magna]MDU5808247.1 CD1871A family CXXC motif-containing protein [Finegoldia magna]